MADDSFQFSLREARLTRRQVPSPAKLYRTFVRHFEHTFSYLGCQANCGHAVPAHLDPLAKGFSGRSGPLSASQNRGFVGSARLDGSRGPPAFANMEMEALEKSKRIWIPHF